MAQAEAIAERRRRLVERPWEGSITPAVDPPEEMLDELEARCDAAEAGMKAGKGKGSSSSKPASSGRPS